MRRVLAGHKLLSGAALRYTFSGNRILINNRSILRSFHSQRALLKDKKIVNVPDDDIVEDDLVEDDPVEDDIERISDDLEDDTKEENGVKEEEDNEEKEEIVEKENDVKGEEEEAKEEDDLEGTKKDKKNKKEQKGRRVMKEFQEALFRNKFDDIGPLPLFDNDEVPGTLQIMAASYPVMPGGLKNFHYFDPDMFKTVINKHSNRHKVGVFVPKPGCEALKQPKASDFEEIGVMAEVLRISSNNDFQEYTAIVAFIRRIKITEVVTDGGENKLPVVKVEPYGGEYDKLTSLQDHSLYADIRIQLEELAKVGSRNQYIINTMLKLVDDASVLVDNAISMFVFDHKKLKEALEHKKLRQRMILVLDVLRKEVENQKILSLLHRKLDEKISGYHRKQLLIEKMKLIKTELGLDQEDKTKEKFLERLKDKQVPEQAKKVIDEELNKLSTLEPSSSEFNVCRNYLEWLTLLPWGVMAQENFDLAHAKKVLDNDHYGLKKIKERILEFIAVGKRKGTVQGKILCFVGPPGVGKTSIGKSIASTLKREYFRFSVGGVHDVAEIKGHRRTYIGAMPGKLIQCLKQAKSMNPVILIDEIDKMGKSPHGDPQSALLEVLDPEQNGTFLDHYLDVPFDLSKVLFVCTANTLSTIPEPLLDRMEVLNISGYIEEEKMEIAKKYLIPKVVKDTGVEGQVTVTDKLLRSLIRDYCRENGCRNLQKHIERIYRKAAYKLVVAEEKLNKKNGVEEVVKELPKAEETVEPLETLNEETVEDDGERISIAELLNEEEDTSSTVTNVIDDNKDNTVASNEIENKDNTTNTTPSNEPIVQVPLEQVEQKAEQDQLQRVNGKQKKIKIQEKDLEDYVGHPNFSSNRYYFKAPSGVVMGLAWTSMGGSTIYIESRVDLGSQGQLKVTGKLGEVMKESSSIAFTFAKSYYDKVIKSRKQELPFIQEHIDQMKRDQIEQDLLNVEFEQDEENGSDADDGSIVISSGKKDKKDKKNKSIGFFSKYSVHMHCPEGSTPKEGPSAGVTITTSLLSLAYNRPVRHGLGMTGEITLTGKVLAIGGVKEKTIAARRSGVVDMILPQESRKEWEEVDKKVKEGINVHFVDYYDDVHKIAFEYDDATQEALIEADRQKIKKESPKMAKYYKL
ncbi:PIM1 [Acrasis kona]|uniref:endopeptidase La n=1 Tax=Acrasis kona TaxID=1008807 RepID=A0AAW2YJ54_9EUKA